MDLEYILSNALRGKHWFDYLVASVYAACALALGVVLLGASQNNGMFMGIHVTHFDLTQLDISGMATAGLMFLAIFAGIAYMILKGLESR